MKKSKIIIIIFLIVLVLGEGYFFFIKKEKTLENNKTNEGSSIVSVSEINKEDEKYLVDITAPYQKNALSLKEIKDDNISYYSITGLKNKEVENKINKYIKDKIYEIKNDKTNSSKYKFYAEVEGSFANVLSIIFYVSGDFSTTKEEYGYYYMYDCRMVDVFNVDLNTGNAIGINDVVIDKNILRTALVDKITEDITKKVGFVCDGGPCENPEPDYGKVEDGVFSIINQYNKNNYLFSVSEIGIEFYFKDVYVSNPTEVYPDEDGVEDYKKCKIYYDDYDVEDEEDYEDYKRYICQDYYETGYSTNIRFLDVVDTVIIYDKFKSDDILYTTSGETISRKFVKSNNGDNWNMYETMEESDNQLIDYNLDTMAYSEDDNKLLDVLKSKVIKEASELKKDKFNIYNINGCVDNIADGKYYYVYFEVTHYNVDKDKYLENKEKIYFDKFDKMTPNSMENELSYKTEYDYLKVYLTKKSYYFYIIDSKGKEYNTKDILNTTYLSQYIPKEWLNLGKYKTTSELLNSVFLMTTEKADFTDRLVLYDDGYTGLKFKYKGKEVSLVDSSDYFAADEIKTNMYK